MRGSCLVRSISLPLPPFSLYIYLSIYLSIYLYLARSRARARALSLALAVAVPLRVSLRASLYVTMCHTYRRKQVPWEVLSAETAREALRNGRQPGVSGGQLELRWGTPVWLASKIALQACDRLSLFVPLCLPLSPPPSLSLSLSLSLCVCVCVCVSNNIIVVQACDRLAEQIVKTAMADLSAVPRSNFKPNRHLVRPSVLLWVCVCVCVCVCVRACVRVYVYVAFALSADQVRPWLGSFDMDLLELSVQESNDPTGICQLSFFLPPFRPRGPTPPPPAPPQQIIGRYFGKQVWLRYEEKSTGSWAG